MQPDGSWVNTNRQFMENDPNLCTAFALLAPSYCDDKPKASNAEVTANDVGPATTSRVAWSLGLRRLFRYLAGFAWAINVGLLLAAFGWILFLWAVARHY